MADLTPPAAAIAVTTTSEDGSTPMGRSVLRRALSVLLVFGAVSASIGGALGVFANGAGVPLSYLANSPFTSYLLPGVILGIVVGGTQLAAVISLLIHDVHRYAWCTVAGFGMLIWIFTELAMMSEYSWLQAVYFAVGILELALVLGILGVLDAPSIRSSGR